MYAAFFWVSYIMFYPAKQILPYRLWVGSERDSQNLEAARRHGVSLVVNCTRNIPFKVPGIKHYRVPIDDHRDERVTFVKHLPRAVALIDEHLSKGGGVLVHCYAGVSRSASVAAAYLMHKEGLTPRQALSRIRRLKPETFGNKPNFFQGLQLFNAQRQSTTSKTPKAIASMPA